MNYREGTQRTGVSTFTIRTNQRTDQKSQKSFHLCHPKEKLFFFKNPFPLKFLKQPSHKPNGQKNRNSKMTEKAQKYNDLTMTVDSWPSNKW